MGWHTSLPPVAIASRMNAHSVATLSRLTGACRVMSTPAPSSLSLTGVRGGNSAGSSRHDKAGAAGVRPPYTARARCSMRSTL